jgi:hypothetical protein
MRKNGRGNDSTIADCRNPAHSANAGMTKKDGNDSKIADCRNPAHSACGAMSGPQWVTYLEVYSMKRNSRVICEEPLTTKRQQPGQW